MPACTKERTLKLYVLIGLIILASSLHAQTAGAVSSGNWNDPTIWTTGTVPGASNDVFVGSTTPPGSAAIATVTLTQNQSASTLTLGNGPSTSGSLHLGSNTLTLNVGMTIGSAGGIGSITEGAAGSFSAPNLNIESSNTFTFGANDAVGSLNLYSGSSATTSATGNVTSSVDVYSGSTLNLGANMSLGSGQLDVENTGSTLNMNGHSLSANNLLLGQFAGQPVTLTNDGGISVNNLYVSGGSDPSLHPGDVVNDLLSITNMSSLSVTQTPGQLTGFTLNGQSADDLSIDSTSHLDLDFGVTSQPDWIFDWQDPNGGGNWISTLEGLIAAGEIDITALDGYSIVDQGGYTYIETNGPSQSTTPEPSTGFLLGLVGTGMFVVLTVKRARSSHAKIPEANRTSHSAGVHARI